MVALSKYADWWDQQKAQTETILNEWVQDNPQWWAVAVATSVQTSMDLGAGFVDVLRFGEGMYEGGVKGYGKDALRMLAILGPLGRAGGVLSRVLNMQMIRLAVKVKGVSGPCTFQAVNNLTAIIRGKSYFITVRDMAAAVGRPIGSLVRNEAGNLQLSSSVEKAIEFMISQGIKVSRMAQAKTVKDVARLAETEDGVVIFAIRCVVKTPAGKLKDIKHTVIAVRDAVGQVRFADYGAQYFTSLEALVARWGTLQGSMGLMQNQVVGVVRTMQITSLLESSLSLVPGSTMLIAGVTALETPDGVEFAAPVAITATSAPAQRDPAPPEIVKASFDAYKERRQGKTVIRMPEIVIKAGQKTAPRPEYLTGVQFRLNALGFGAGRVDGIKGPKTSRAVTKFQKAYPPLKVDGIPGPKTQEKLVEICGF
ncbi:peptidoglycan-binding domain-containing protein [Bosea sp. BH3]|uniref:peptidoglycan-binding domain-containing protein n=1 Tax=Bosea sp. BH3 TaxID=2871701 RepID=UPI0021CB787A|nr:peptidoglycan-binding domain-containing protein [Bosea sp. BH3]